MSILVSSGPDPCRSSSQPKSNLLQRRCCPTVIGSRFGQSWGLGDFGYVRFLNDSMLANRELVFPAEDRGALFVMERRCLHVENLNLPTCGETCPVVTLHSSVWRCGVEHRFCTVSPIPEMFFRDSVTSESTDACQLQARQECTPQLIES